MESEPKRYYSIADIQSMIGCSRTTAYFIAKELQHIRIGRKIYVPIIVFENWLKEQRKGEKHDKF